MGSFDIDTGPEPWEPVVYSAGLDTSSISYRGRGTDAERVHRKIICQIQEFEDAEKLDQHYRAESLIIDSLWLDYPQYAEAIDQAYEDHRMMLTGEYWSVKQLSAMAEAGAPDTAQSETSKGNRKMFEIDTGSTGGSLGPWMTWTSEGSARKGFQPESWVIRGKDENDEKYERMFDGFKRRCVMDLDSLKLGWEKDGGKGIAPERRWNASVSRAEPRPDDSKKASGGYAWSQALQVRVAISKTEAATWEQGSFGAYQAFVKLAKQIQAEHPGDNRLPVVVQTGVEKRSLGNGDTAIPILEVVDWVQRPDVLKGEVTIATTQEPAPAPEPAPAAKKAPEPEPAMADGDEF